MKNEEPKNPMKQDTDINKNLADFLLGSPESVDESEVIPENQEILYMLYSPSDIQRAKESALHLNRHNLYSIMIGASGVNPLEKAHNVTPLSKEEKEQILKKIEITNIFMDYAKSDAEKEELIRIAKSKEMSPSDLSVRMAQHVSNTVPKSEIDGFREKLHTVMLNAESEAIARAKKDKYEEYKRIYNPNKKLTVRTATLAGILGLATLGLVVSKSFKNEREMRDYYNRTRPAIERSILRENGLDDSKVQEKPLEKMTFGEFLRNQFRKDTLSVSGDEPYVAPRAGPADATGKDTTGTKVNADSLKYKAQAVPAKAEKSLADSLKTLGNAEFVNFLSSRIPQNYVLLVKPSGLTEKYDALPRNAEAEKRFKQIKSMEISGETFTNLVDTVRLNKKLNALQSFGLQNLDNAAGYAALDELVWLSYNNMGDVPLKKVSGYIDLFMKNYGSTGAFETENLKTMLQYKTVVQQWASQSAKDVDLAVVQWLNGLSKQNNKLGHEASYICANITAGNNTIYAREGDQKFFMTLPKATMPIGGALNGQMSQSRSELKLGSKVNLNMDTFIGYLSNSARGDSLSASRALYSLSDFVASHISTPEAYDAVLNHAITSLKYGGLKTAWAPNTLYLIADMEEKLGNRDVSMATINVMNKLFPNNEYTSMTMKLKDKIDAYYQDVKSKENQKQEAEYQRVKNQQEADFQKIKGNK